jgi:hypothetical protein
MLIIRKNIWNKLSNYVIKLEIIDLLIWYLVYSQILINKLIKECNITHNHKYNINTKININNIFNLIYNSISMLDVIIWSNLMMNLLLKKLLTLKLIVTDWQ